MNGERKNFAAERPMKPERLDFQGGVLRTASGEAAPWPRLALLGGRIGHSLSPLLHDAALRGLDLDGVYRAVRLSEDDFPSFLREASRHGIEGLNVTLPHKELALVAAASQAPSAREVGAANVLVARGEGWEAHNTDADGFLDAVDECFRGVDWAKGDCVVIGAGGAARAVVVALVRRKVSRIRVLAREVERARWAERFGARVESLGGAGLRKCSLLVQATPLGLSPSDPSPVDPLSLPEGCAVMDLCYGPSPSRLVRSVAGQGPVCDGRPMLLAQAVRSFQLWFPDLDPAPYMRSSLRAVLG